jgi:hypothetical protein
MLISEQSFPHLQAAHDARLEQELERRRVARERLGEPAVDVLGASPRRHRAWWQRSGERMLRGRAVAHPAHRGSARPA